MMKKKKQRSKKGACFFCQTGNVPDYKKAEELTPFLTERAKIINRGRTGVCAKHQRQLAKEIKRARHLALLPFVTKV
jgi:small subunit ribosomal protein S18